MAMNHPYPNPTNDPEFYCEGQACIDGGCTPLRCKKNPDHMESEGPWCPQNGYDCEGCEACC